MLLQPELTNTIETLISKNKLPQSLILVGKYGCGKHTFARFIANKLNREIIDLTDNIIQETLDEIYTSTIPTLYLIDATKITEKEQNILLKTLEEPSSNSTFILITEQLNTLLPTIRNRCQIYSFQPYTKEQLSSFTTNEEILDYCDTPGLILELQNTDFKIIIELCNKVLTKITLASYSNLFVIPNKLYYNKVEGNKIEFNLFAEVLVKEAIRLYKSAIISFTAYNITKSFYANSKIVNIDKQMLLKNYLVTLKASLGSM